MIKKIGALVLLGCALAFAACGNDESREDADDVQNGQVEKSEPNVTAFNNHYPNVQHKCLYSRDEPNVVGKEDGGVGKGIGLRVVVTSSSATLVIADPHCPGYLPEQAGTTASVAPKTPSQE